jgi:hypothetical protein
LILSKYASFIEHLLEQGCSVVGCRLLHYQMTNDEKSS